MNFEGEKLKKKFEISLFEFLINELKIKVRIQKTLNMHRKTILNTIIKNFFVKKMKSFKKL